MYHYVRPIKNSVFSNIKGLEFEDFKKQLGFFKKNFSFISMQDILDCVYENKELQLELDHGDKDCTALRGVAQHSR